MRKSSIIPSEIRKLVEADIGKRKKIRCSKCNSICETIPSPKNVISSVLKEIYKTGFHIFAVLQNKWTYNQLVAYSYSPFGSDEVEIRYSKERYYCPSCDY